MIDPDKIQRDLEVYRQSLASQFGGKAPTIYLTVGDEWHCVKCYGQNVGIVDGVNGSLRVAVAECAAKYALATGKAAPTLDRIIADAERANEDDQGDEWATRERDDRFSPR